MYEVKRQGKSHHGRERKRKEIEMLMQQLSREQLTLYITYLKALSASAEQH